MRMPNQIEGSRLDEQLRQATDRGTKLRRSTSRRRQATRAMQSSTAVLLLAGVIASVLFLSSKSGNVPTKGPVSRPASGGRARQTLTSNRTSGSFTSGQTTTTSSPLLGDAYYDMPGLVGTSKASYLADNPMPEARVYWVSASSSSAKPGTITSQFPTAGVGVSGGSEIGLWVAGSAPNTRVPDVTGLSKASAVHVLRSKGFRQIYSMIDGCDNPSQPFDEVASQDPPGNAMALASDSIVSIYVNGC